MGEVDGAKAVSVVLRIAALGTSVPAAVMIATASQLLADGRVVSYGDYTALLYFVVASAALALYLYLSVRGGGGGASAGSLAVSLLDAAAQAFLFSAAGAASSTWRAPPPCSAGRWAPRRPSARARPAVSVAALTKDAARGCFTVTFAGSGCKHGC